MHRVLITGAAGAIGSTLREGLRGRFSALRLLDTASLGEAQQGEELRIADVRDLPALTGAMADVDATIHLAGIPHEDTFERIRDTNMTGTYHVFEAARRQGCTRVVLASSAHVTGFYRTDEHIGPDAPARPDTFYGLGKTFAEHLGRLYADKYALEVACLRLGTFAEQPTDPRHLSTWLSPRDTVDLFYRAVTAPDLGFVVVYGVSANQRRWWDLSSAERLGYRPVDDAELWASQLDTSGDHAASDDLQGGDYARPVLRRETRPRN